MKLALDLLRAMRVSALATNVLRIPPIGRAAIIRAGSGFRLYLTETREIFTALHRFLNHGWRIAQRWGALTAAAGLAKPNVVVTG